MLTEVFAEISEAWLFIIWSEIMSDFYEKVYEVVRLIPSGRVTSYGAIARYLGTGGSADKNRS